MDKLVEKIAKFLADNVISYDKKWADRGLVGRTYFLTRAEKLKELFLSDPNIVEIDPDAELPVWSMAEQRDEFGNATYILAQQDMLKAGWVKPKKGVTNEKGT